jgi:hypothetical protein
MSQRASYIGAIRADQTVESDHSDLFGTVGNMLAWTRALTEKANLLFLPLEIESPLNSSLRVSPLSAALPLQLSL